VVVQMVFKEHLFLALRFPCLATKSMDLKTKLIP
jgi:hypothetical protein